MSDVEPVAISFNNSLIAVNLTVSPGSGSNVCSRKLHRKINRGFFNGTNKLGEELKKKIFRQFSSFWEGKSYSWNNCPEISSALLENDWFISLL